MGTTPANMGKPYRAILEENWEAMTAYYKKHNDQVLFPITARRDTALHMAAFSNKRKPVNDLLDIIKGFTIDVNEDALMIQNAFGMTPLHEAATCGNYHAVELLVKDYPQLLDVKNVYGETALFRASVFGHTNIVKYLAKQPGQMDANNKLLDIHRVRPDTTSILHVAVQGEHYDTALLLLTLDESLGEAMDNRGVTALHLLANLPSAFRSGYSEGQLKRFIYFCLPNEDDHDTTKVDHIPVPLSQGDDLEIGQSRHQYSNLIRKVMRRIKLSICGFFFQGWPVINRIWDDKRRHEAALRIAKLLIKKDASLNEAMKVVDSSTEIPAVMFNPAVEREGEAEETETVIEINEKEETQPFRQPSLPAPLFTATRRGIKEIVHEILKQYPQAVEYHSDMGQNILHVAVMHRRKEIFDLVKHKRIPLLRMHHAIDRKGYTLLHHAADTKHYTGGTTPGPALQLQEELQWFERVKEVVLSHYVIHCDRVHKKTPKELFEEKHHDQLTEAQKWTKDTSQSCSAVAVLVSTVVFAAIYTVPGGSEKGVPIFLHSPYFLFFTVTDVMALASSLTSVVMFLSVLTSPFHFQDFFYSLPRKLTFGFALLFFSVMATMLAFGATIVLVIRTSKGWTTGLIGVAAFLPVSVFLLMQFHLYKAFMVTLGGFFKSAKKSLPLRGRNRK